MHSLLHLWLPLALLGSCIAMAWVGGYCTYRRSVEAAINRKIRSAEEAGKVVRASALDSSRGKTSPVDDAGSTRKPLPITVSPSSNEVSPRSDADDSKCDDVSPRSGTSEGTAKEGWSLLAATRARLQIDGRTAREKTIRSRVERARRLNRSRRSSAPTYVRTPSREERPAANGASDFSDIAPVIPSWDDDMAGPITQI